MFFGFGFFLAFLTIFFNFIFSNVYSDENQYRYVLKKMKIKDNLKAK